MTQTQDETAPAILCFHGHGTNATIFHYQLRHIIKTLGVTFRFVFVDAPFEVSHPGHGVLPTFVDVKPFRRWNCDDIAADVFGVSVEDVKQEKLQVRDLLAENLERERQRGPGIVGVLAFSQGARVATGLCLDREMGINIKFVIMICGAFPPILLAPEPLSHPLDMVSIHIQRTTDPWKSQSTKLSETYFNSARARTIKFNGGHAVPAGIKEAETIADEVMAAWNPSSIPKAT
jgi:predicted esterase